MREVDVAGRPTGGSGGSADADDERFGEAAERPAGGTGRPRAHEVAAVLVRPVWRTLPRTALAAGAGLGLLLACTPRLLSGEVDPWLCLNLLRAAVLAYALGLAFLLDDPARHTTAAVPTRRPVRIGVRLGLVAPLTAAWWTAALFLVPEAGRPPVGAVTLEAAALAALALAAATVAVRLSEATEPGLAVSAGLVGTVFTAALLLPERWELFVATNDPHWDDAHRRWAGVLVVAVLVGAGSLAEPLRRRRATVPGRR
ncbi:ABC transporter [Streptomyces sp. NPDC051362]|uniref:ABC transporter n=1 Tax=Streptomyces sp. NPDC051362 TaxID=3365651 RepID=UPI0037B659A2